MNGQKFIRKVIGCDTSGSFSLQQVLWGIRGQAKSAAQLNCGHGKTLPFTVNVAMSKAQTEALVKLSPKDNVIISPITSCLDDTVKVMSQ